MTTINLTELFEIQRKLDAEIERKHPSVDGEDRLMKRILALQVELGECANEWRGFKFWSTNQEARTIYQTTCRESEATHYYCDNCKKEIALGECADHSHECEWLLYPMKAKNPLLEEYVDCLHFILSIGLEQDFYSYHYTMDVKPVKEKNIVHQFSQIFHYLHEVEFDGDDKYFYMQLVRWFIGLGEMFDFTWNQIETAYMSKNAKNWVRQAEGY